MDKCSDCGENCRENHIVLECAGQRLTLCSFECLITHSAASVRRRIERRNRKAERYAQAQRRCTVVRSRHAGGVRR
jgi:hypothetical protein